MNKEQNDKFEAWWNGPQDEGMVKISSFVGWAACLEANGIGEDGRRMDTEHGSRIVDKSRESNLAEAIPEGYFKIGEEVEMKAGDEWVKGRVWATNKLDDFPSPMTASMSKPELVRRIPAWKPKDGEAVFVNLIEGIQVAKVLSADDGNVVQVLFSQGEKRAVELARLKPLDASKIGKPWSEI